MTPNPFAGMPPPPTKKTAPVRLTSATFTKDTDEKLTKRLTAAQAAQASATTPAAQAVADARQQVLSYCQTQLKSWDNAQRASASALHQQHAPSMYDNSLLIQAKADIAIVRQDQKERKLQTLPKPPNVSGWLSQPIAAFAPIYAATLVVGAASYTAYKAKHARKSSKIARLQALRAPREAALAADITQHKADMATLANALKAEFDAQIAALKQQQQQALDDINDPNNGLTDTDRVTLRKEVDTLYQEMRINYTRLHEDRVANAEDLCNRPRTVGLIANGNPEFNTSADFQANVNRPLYTPMKAGDKFDLPTLKLLPAANLQEMRLGRSRTFAPIATVKEHNGGICFDINLKDFRTNVTRHGDIIGKFGGVECHPNSHDGSMVINAYVDAYRGLRMHDPNAVINIEPILIDLNIADQREFIQQMVANFGNVPMGIEGPAAFKDWADMKQEFVTKRGLDVSLRGGRAPALNPAANMSTNGQITPPPTNPVPSNQGTQPPANPLPGNRNQGDSLLVTARTAGQGPSHFAQPPQTPSAQQANQQPADQPQRTVPQQNGHR